MDLGLRGKTAVVSGGSEGIGYATALSLAREGANVIIAARRESVLQDAAARINADLPRSTEPQVIPISCDVSRPEGVALLMQSGGGSIVNVLNLGAKQPGAASVPTSVSRAAGMALTKALSKEFAPDNIRVNAVLIGLVKSGQHARSWRARSAAAGGDVSAQSLDDFYTAMVQQRAVPLGRIAEAEEAGDLITFLCSSRATYITGTAINFDGGTSAVV